MSESSQSTACMELLRWPMFFNLPTATPCRAPSQRIITPTLIHHLVSRRPRRRNHSLQLIDLSLRTAECPELLKMCVSIYSHLGTKPINNVRHIAHRTTIEFLPTIPLPTPHLLHTKFSTRSPPNPTILPLLRQRKKERKMSCESKYIPAS